MAVCCFILQLRCRAAETARAGGVLACHDLTGFTGYICCGGSCQCEA